MIDYKRALADMYASEFYTDDGKCKFYNECKSSVDTPECKFCSDKANFGELYGEDPSIPRIVVVGLEGLGKQGIVSEIEKPSLSAYNSHYKGVRYVLAYLLSEWLAKEKPTNSLKAVLQTYSDETISKYVLLNCYKCAFKDKSQGLPHTNSMMKNCVNILLREIEILKPEILIIQVVSGRPEQLTELLSNRYGYDNNKPIIGGDHTGLYKMRIPDNEADTLVLWTYHGSGSPIKDNRAWTNDNGKGCRYIKGELNGVLDRTIEEYKKLHSQS